jgi:glycosyltransferase involved in cell wall biosynthesis
MGVCTEYARTQVIALDVYSNRPTRNYDGVVSVEADHLDRYVTESEIKYRCKTRIRNWSWRLAFQNRTQNAEGRSEAGTGPGGRASLSTRLKQGLVYHLGGLAHSALQISDLWTSPIRPMLLRSETVFVAPTLIVCHDVWSLEAGIRLKRRFGCKLLYDNHEYSPHAHLSGHPLEAVYWERYERRLCRSVDALITVTPGLAALVEKKYGLRGRAYAVPNAAPLTLPRTPSHTRPIRYPVTFLVQGVAVPGRGFEALLDCWGQLNDPCARLWLRCPASDYLADLRRQYAHLLQNGSLEILPPVGSEDLIEAATVADVGIIPYPARVGEWKVNYNHLYCCPNKLSQYMQAGLAILSTNTHFVSSCLRKYQCGVTYDPEQPATLLDAVRGLVDDPQKLQRMKETAFHWAQTDYHWDRQADAYRAVIESLTGLTRQPARGGVPPMPESGPDRDQRVPKEAPCPA